MTSRWGSGSDEADFALRQIAAALACPAVGTAVPVPPQPRPRLEAVVVFDRPLIGDGVTGGSVGDGVTGGSVGDGPAPAGHEGDGAFDVYRLGDHAPRASAKPGTPPPTWAWVPLLDPRAGVGAEPASVPSPRRRGTPEPWPAYGARIQAGPFDPQPQAERDPERAPSVILVTSEAEAALARAQLSRRACKAGVANVGLSLAINPLALDSAPLGLGLSDYLLVLAAWPEPEARYRTPVAGQLHRRMALRGRGHTTITVGTDRLIIEHDGSRHYRPAPRGRTDLWRLMARARVVVDLRTPRYLGREAIESLLIGTPIVVPDTGPAADHALAGGGCTFATKDELFEGTEALWADSTRRRLAGRQGQAWASQRYGDRDRFVARVQDALNLI
ncbi:MAG: glycosyltransferase [Acidimicrobiales bacterium]